MTSMNSAASGREWNPLTVALLTSLWIAGPANWPLWHILRTLPEGSGSRGGVFIAGFALALALLTFSLLSILAWRGIIKLAAALFLVPAAAAAHFMGTYGVVIDSTMITNVLQTNITEARDLVNLRLLASMAILALLPMGWLWRQRVRTLTWRAQLGRNLVALVAAAAATTLLIFVLFADLSATMRNHKSVRYLINPLNSFFALGVLAKQASAKPQLPLLPIGEGASLSNRPADGRPPLFLLVVGETARADHFATNGYPRPTTPELTALHVASFRNVSSCGTNTAESLPCMFSPLDRSAHVARERDHENLLDLAQHVGLAVLWIENQSGCKEVCNRVPTIQASAGAPPTLCSEGECLDEALLHDLDAHLDGLDPARRARGVLLVMHQMGSHGPAYSRRSPPDRKPFMPECTTTVLRECEPQALINAYDNSIAYTDHMLAGAIAWLGHQQTRYRATMLYVSDHGESLGENGLYLHGLPYALAPRDQTHVPLVVWAAPDSGVGMDCLASRLDVPLSHDNLFHTVAGALGIVAHEYHADLDMLAPCRAR